MTRSLILDVDTQVDFMNKDGKLYVPGAENIKTALSDVMLHAMGCPVISTMDSHSENDIEFDTYPPHCIIGTDGWNKIPETMPYGNHYVYDEKVNSLAMQYIIRKKTYNVWDPSLGNPIAMYKILSNIEPANIFIMGVALDVCVIAAARGLAKFNKESKLGSKLWVIEDAVEALTDEGFMRSIKEMRDLDIVPICSHQLTGII